MVKAFGLVASRGETLAAGGKWKHRFLLIAGSAKEKGASQSTFPGRLWQALKRGRRNAPNKTRKVLLGATLDARIFSKSPDFYRAAQRKSRCQNHFESVFIVVLDEPP